MTDLIYLVLAGAGFLVVAALLRAVEGLTMLDLILGLAVAAGPLFYLILALLRPDRF